MIDAEHPTEQQILDRIAFHETGAAHYDKCDGAASMAVWSKERVELWRKKLEALHRKTEVPS